ncbi:MAG: hypothetical protein DIJKHBIC_01246 [Thermoanaerobaculia bacterium]|nr:hypothetical protein [Thermoanaerobaculia bacterium]
MTDGDLDLKTEVLCLRMAWIGMAAALLFVFFFHMVPALVAGLVVFVILHRMTGLMSGRVLSRGAAKVLAAGLMGLLAALGAAVLLFALFGFASGKLGSLPTVFSKMADIVDRARDQLLSRGMDFPVLERLADESELKGAFSEWLRQHASELTRAGGEAGKFLVHVLMGAAVAILAFFGRPEASEKPASEKPLSRALMGRISRFSAAFENIVVAQVEISAINTAFTAVYIFLVLPLFGAGLPFSGTLVMVTFVAGLIPVIGNLVSNTAIVVMSLSVSPWTALASLGFLIGIHKLEYLVNARIVGSKIGATAWEILTAIIVFEVAFGVPGVVLAPIIYAYTKTELKELGLI